jgi:microcystin-dependent protein
LYTDEEFVAGSNSVGVYNNSGGDGVVITRMTAATAGVGAPNGSGYVLEIRHNGNTTSPPYGGFIQSITARRNATFAQVFRAKLPVGYTLNLAENPQGTNQTSYWLSSNIGTGKWEEYVRVSHCGNTGTFSQGGHVYVTGSPAPTSGANLVWYLASCTVYDATDVRQGLGSGLDADLLDGLHAVSFASGVAAVSQTNFDLIKQPGLYQYDGTMTGTLPPIGSSNFRTVEVGSNARYSQIALPYNADGLCVRRMTDAAWSAWRTVLHDGNYNNYAPSLTGAGASGASWAIGITGNAATATKATATVTGTNSVELVRGNMADNDQFRILVGGTASNAGYAEIATADDGTEPIYVRQYTGAFAVIVRTATLLDGSGNTSFPGKVGIGCTPTDMLHVSGAGDVALRLQSTTPTTGRTFTIGSNGTGGLMVWDQTAGAGRLFIDSSGNVNVLGTLQEAGSRVWTAATLAGDRSNSQGFLTTTAASRLADLNSPPYGFSYWDSTSTNRPYGYGTLLSWAYGGTGMTAAAGNWLFELGISTDATPRLVFRHNINGNGWSSWCEAWTNQNLTNLNQLTNGPGYALLASPTFTGTPAAPTAAALTNTTQLATTAFVLSNAGTASPLMDGTVAVGVGLRYAREDHRHPTDTSTVLPTGSVLAFAGSAAPSGYLLCDGAAVSRTTYAALYAVVGTTYGTGDGSTTFNVPDGRSRTVVGAGQGAGLTNRTRGGGTGAAWGEESHTLSEAEMPSHTHVDTGHDHGGAVFAGSTHSHRTAIGFDSSGTLFCRANSLYMPMDGSDVQLSCRFTAGLTQVAESLGRYAFTGSPSTGAAIPSGSAAISSAGSGSAHNNMPPFLVMNYIIKT